MPRVRLWASTAALAVIVSVPRPADSIRCWGANAIALQREHGEVKSCTHGAEQFDLYRYEGDDVCFDKCGGVTWFEGFSTGGAPFANPDGKRLCPGVVDKGECNCEAWHKTLTPNAKGNHGCPQCDDYAVLPPLIRTRNTPSARWSKWVKLEECPAEYDMCVDYCYREPAFMGAAKWCFFGCAQSAYVQAMGVAVASQLSHLDYRKQWNTGRMTIYSDYHPPNTMFCTQSEFDCHQKFCQEDGCNTGPGYTKNFVWDRFKRHWPPLLLLSLVAIIFVIAVIVPWITGLVRVHLLGLPAPAESKSGKRKQR